MPHQFITDTDIEDLPESLHLRTIVEALTDHSWARATSWHTEAEAIPLDESRLRYRFKGTYADEGWYTDEDSSWSAHARRDPDGEVLLHVAAASEAVLNEAEAWFRTALPQVAHDPNAPNVPVTFWSLSEEGPISRYRRLDVPTWAGIATNYPDAVRAELATLMADGSDLAGGGKLVLWHGDPGTGKTWGLRALASEWRDWCDVHYITDPETFFGASANYMLQVLLADGSDDDDGDFQFDDDNDTGPKVRKKADRWRLLVMEDTGELLSADAKERVGQGLSRLLNTVDGLIGQGLKIMVLITTNEEVKNLHPAVRRPGRCASLIRFEPFSPSEATEWLAARDYDGPDGEITSDVTVADLYAKLHGLEPVVEEAPAVGFGF